MYFLWTSLIISFFALMCCHPNYDEQHVNRQIFRNDGHDSNGRFVTYNNRQSYPQYNNYQPIGSYGKKSGGITGYKKGISQSKTSANIELNPNENNQENDQEEEETSSPVWHMEPVKTSTTATATEPPVKVETETPKKIEENGDNPIKDSNKALKAIAVLRGKAKGILYFEQIGDKVQITGSIEGLSNGLHAFHVHQFGDLSRSCDSSGDHYNPYNTKHGSPFDSVRHVGDLGNVFADESGVAKIDLNDKIMSLGEGKNNIIGHTIIVHENVDDLGRGGHVKAGRRIGCGIIGWRNDL